MLFSRIWTKEPLTEIEKAGMLDPMSGVIYKHGGQIPVEWQLAAAVAAAAAPRYLKHKEMIKAEKEKNGAPSFKT